MADEMATTMTFEAAAYTGRGTQRERVALPGELFDGTVNMPVMHQAVKAFLANQRQGNASTKTRGLVTGGNQKPWKQKGTGRARQGSTRAPHWVGGGTVFGPTPRAYDEFVPRQVRALARKSAFNARARENAVIVVDRFDFEAPKTSQMQALINSLGVAGQKVLVLTDGVKPNVFLSARNLPTTHVMPYSDVSTYHVLWSDVVVIEGGAIGQTLEPIAESETATRSARKPAPAKRTTSKGADRARREAAEAAERGDETPMKADSKAKAKSAAKKSATKKPAAKKAAAKSGTKASAAKKSTAKKSAAKKSSKKKGGE
jgi:large subunit ribosomal protein L4